MTSTSVCYCVMWAFVHSVSLGLHVLCTTEFCSAKKVRMKVPTSVRYWSPFSPVLYQKASLGKRGTEIKKFWICVCAEYAGNVFLLWVSAKTKVVSDCFEVHLNVSNQNTFFDFSLFSKVLTYFGWIVKIRYDLFFKYMATNCWRMRIAQCTAKKQYFLCFESVHCLQTC